MFRKIIPYHMGKAIYEASPAKVKYLHTVADGKHGNLLYEDPELYKILVLDFTEN